MDADSERILGLLCKAISEAAQMQAESQCDKELHDISRAMNRACRFDNEAAEARNTWESVVRPKMYTFYKDAMESLMVSALVSLARRMATKHMKEWRI